MTFAWTDDATAELRKCVDDGFSAKHAADHLHSLFGGSPSRNSIIGKALRTKLQWKNASGQRRAVQNPKRVRPARRGPPAWHEASHAEAASARPVEAPRAIPPAPNSKPVDLMGLTNSTCRWPITDDSPHMFCGAIEADMSDGVPYCALHTAAARGISRNITDLTRDQRASHARRMGKPAVIAADRAVDLREV